MLLFWRNPEFIRHRRAEARPARVALVLAVLLVIYGVIGLGSWSATEHAGNHLSSFATLFFGWLFGGSAATLCIWSFFAGMQAVARERELKTFDFLRSTRLSAAELLVGKLVGGPVLAYIIFGCVFPFAAVAAALGGITVRQFVLSYLLALAYALFVGLFGLWLSSMMQKQQSGAMVVPILFLAWGLAIFNAEPSSQSSFPVLASLIPAPAFQSLYLSGTSYPRRPASPLFFGHPISWVALALLIYAAFGAWLVLALVRNLKKELPEQRTFSSPQLLGFSLFLNFLFYAFLNFSSPGSAGYESDVAGFFVSALMCNAFLFYAVGIAALPSRERLRIWWRERSASTQYFAEDGPVWPWIASTALIGFLCFLFYSKGAGLSSADWPLRRWLLADVVFLVFALRDVLFLQWCTLTRMNRAVTKGVLLLAIYYFAAVIVLMFCHDVSPTAGNWAEALLTSFYPVSDSNTTPVLNPLLAASGIAVQLALAICFLQAIAARLARSARLLAQAA